ncbi:MAG: response regulator [Dysgonamonadaceae bacterium]|jgi:signal transduction histidine kinase/ligand-binding sensor domain-containing protein/CheY-like chemotaxis protein/AraC-like DNA-binding protein|nr:response regulator [Dysgonamonadaceae bacterium]
MKSVFVAILFLLSISSIARESRHYTAIQGLLGSDVTAICKNENFLWIATNEGLNRFDGKKFKVYEKANNSTNSLSENNIETLMFDSNGLLWIGLKAGGVDIYDPKKDKFIHISQLTKTYPHRVISIYEDSKQSIWLGTWEEGIYKLEPTPGKPLDYTITRHYDNYIVSDFIEKPEGILWAGTYNGYFLYDIAAEKWINEYDENGESIVITQFLDAGGKNTLWCTTWQQGLLKIAWKENDFLSIQTQRYLTQYKNLYSAHYWGGNKIYLGTWGEGIKAVEITPNGVIEATAPRLNAPVILSFFRDKYNKTWVGTYGNGFYRLNTEGSGINYLSPINRNGLSAVHKVCSYTDNRLLVGTQGDGLYLYDVKQQQLIPKRFPFYNTTFTNYILSLYCDEELLIVGHDDAGIAYTPFSGGKTADFELKQFFAGARLTKVTSIFRDDNSRIWLGTKQNGLMSLKYDVRTKAFTDFVYCDSFGHGEITGFVKRDNEHLWIASHSGLYLFNTIAGRVEDIPNIGKIPEIIYCLVDDKKNRCLWLGTSTGIRKLDYASGAYKLEDAFPTEILPAGAIYDLSLDAENNLWFSVVNRIFCFVNEEHKLKEINAEIFGDQIFLSSSNAGIDGKEQIVFGGTDNLALINPQIFLHQPDQTKIVFTELQIDHNKVNVGEKVYGKVILNDETEYISSVTLSYFCKWISLSFTEVGWDYYCNKYQYRISGFSNSWQYLDITKPLTFSQLPPGEYTLSIRPYDVFSENESVWNLQMKILPPWWQTGGFYVLSAILIILSLITMFFVIKNYYKRRGQQRSLEMEKKKKEELLQEKESFFAGLSHDLLTPFSLIIAPANDLLRENLQGEKREKVEIIAKNAGYLSDIFTTILDLKRAEFIDMEIKEKQVELVSFCRLIVNAFDYLAKSKRISLSCQSEIPKLMISFDTVKLERILYNLLSNSIKFTPEGGSINVSLSVSKEKFTLRITDTGGGIDSKNLSKVFNKFYQEAKYRNKMQGLGLGLYIVRSFVDKLGGELDIQSEPGKGTDIGITFPFRRIPELKNPTENIREDEFPAILLVEDNTQLREYLKKELSTHFQVMVRENGVEGLEFIKDNLPEIVISDVMMPEMDGLTLCRKIKTTPLLSDIFVVLLSAKSSTEDKLQGYKAGADFYVQKPFDSQILINQVLNIYTTRQQRRKQIMYEFLSFPDPGKTENTPKNDFFGRAVKIIEDHLMDENFKMDEFAAEMAVSKTILHRKFKVIIGETPNIFIRNVRIRKAAGMLKNTDLTVAEIAYLTGFSQSHYFIKCFKEIYGTTPKSFRAYCSDGKKS